MVAVKDLAPTATVKFFGAGTAACVADLITFPLDTAKVRLQVREGKKILSHIHTGYHLECLTTMTQTFTQSLFAEMCLIEFSLFDLGEQHKGEVNPCAHACVCFRFKENQSPWWEGR